MSAAGRTEVMPAALAPLRGLFAALLVSLSAALPLAAAPNSAPAITSADQYADMSRTLAGGRYFSVPQLMFVIDRADRSKDRPPRLYFVNSNRYEFHIDFVQRTYLSSRSLEELLDQNYSRPDRRFTFGSIVHYPGLGRYGVEFFEGDVIDEAILRETMDLLGANFFAPLAYKPNSSQQQDLAAAIPGLALIDSEAAYGSRDRLILNPGKAVGRLRVIAAVTADLELAPDDIVMVDEPPLRLEPVAGLISTAFSTPLSHVNLLAKSWGVPNVYLRNASAFAALDGQMVALDARGLEVTVRRATPAEIKASARTVQRKTTVLKADLKYAGLPSLAEQRAADSIRLGAKSANLGAVTRYIGRRDDFAVPEGFTIPFSAYAAFVKANHLDRQIDALLADKAVRGDRKRRREALAALRKAFSEGAIDPTLMKAVLARRSEVIGVGGVFARSSTNAEDLPGFNGAGLYTSVPNVITEAQLADAIRTVWGSVWNDVAFEAREAARIDHRSVAAAVLIQRGMNATSSGVMVTENPFDPEEVGGVFINAKRGLGMRVVEGKLMAEQLIYHRDTDGSIQVLTRSADDVMVVFDEAGGVKEAAVEAGRVVLTDDLARRLATIGLHIEASFDGAAQDIEWLTVGDRIYVVQARPYLRGYRAEPLRR
jgi:hypothetical protein